MTLFLWKRSYETRNLQIDMQHRQLVGLINALSDAMMSKQGHRAVHHVLGELVDYAEMHFATEEALMQKTRYPGLDQHRQEHLALKHKVLEFKSKDSAGDERLPQGLLHFLCDWLKDHILVSDKAFGKYLSRVEVELEKNH